LPLHSNRLFLRRLCNWLEEQDRHGRRPAMIMARHLKIAHALLRHFPDIPMLYEAHEVFADVAPPAKRERLSRIEESVLRRAKALVAITQGVAMDLKKRYRLDRDIQVLPDAVAWPAQVPEKPWHEAGRHIVYAGSFFPWKGVQDLVVAAEWLPGCRIELIGGSPERIHEYRSQVPADGAEVVFAGHVTHPQTLQALGQACIGVAELRRAEQFMSSPVFEYMAAGCAVVTADLPSVREVLAHGGGIWVPPGDPRALADGIRKLVNDPEHARQLGERVRERARAFTWEARAARLAAIMRAAL
jgi:glycosyltransferase involved in cell wall biosynthesis